jgi:hypothetical protein
MYDAHTINSNLRAHKGRKFETARDGRASSTRLAPPSKSLCANHDHHHSLCLKTFTVRNHFTAQLAIAYAVPPRDKALYFIRPLTSKFYIELPDSSILTHILRYSGQGWRKEQTV